MSHGRITRFTGASAFLSNFSDITVEIVSTGNSLPVVYPTAEHAFNAAKTTDPDERAWVIAAPTPAEAKRRGRRVTLRPHWDHRVRYQAMDSVLRAKFPPGREVTALLLATGQAFLEEGNSWHDNTWGNCTCGRRACAAPGANFLGHMLMRLRDIRAGRIPASSPLLDPQHLAP
ncbi:hypothetical protein GCM10010156_49480 [Planobispora rosea]|uniref:NADAR domain-containing protein n=1 Tax=Planobispora rosea TaxID=35762 RepID=A0A8J3S438_PLARO|nr:NADAR family protein [Planobispora rosea]GGS84972.1 hypothetical protein GCM10010156_49480 [Planobispora rosea]GIH86459.1 hypothetical protein Pro02_48670 [Planobispora rosea]